MTAPNPLYGPGGDPVASPDKGSPALRPAYDAVYAVIHKYPPRSADDYGRTYENARVWRAVDAAVPHVRAAERKAICEREGHNEIETTAMGDAVRSLQCARCGARWTAPLELNIERGDS